jgi:DNA-binding NtrC family response regulator
MALAKQSARPMTVSKVTKMSDINRILIVDDDEVVRRSYLRSLESISCNVEAANDGEEALQTMEQKPFDVVLLDMRMPGQDGLSVLRTIKQKWPESEVVIITGYPTVASVKEAVRLGAYDYLSKPVGPQDVINITDGAMTRKRWALRRLPEESDAASDTRAA